MNELRSIQEVTELRDLQLLAVEGDGTTTLVSRKHRVVLADAEHLGYDETEVPTFTLDNNLEKAITKEVLHSEYDGSFPWVGLSGTLMTRKSSSMVAVSFFGVAVMVVLFS